MTNKQKTTKILQKSYLIACLMLIFACVPQGTTKQSDDNNVATRGRRTTSREGNNSRQPTDIKEDNTTISKDGRKLRNTQTTEPEIAINQDSLHIAKLAASALNRQTQRNSRQAQNKSNSQSNPFNSREELLKDVTQESNRFIDTTYYVLKMEGGATEILNSTTSGSSNTQEFYENLIRSFMKTVEESEKATTFDCSMFKMYENQLNFNDSLLQEVRFAYAECCASNDNLTEATVTLEELCKERMNRGVAPKILVRLGQLYCVLGENSQAQRYFNRLKKEFPRSMYNQLANCDRL